MNILALIKPAFAALKYGSSLSNPAFWANVGGVTVVLRLVRDAAQAFFPDVALISNDIVGHGADFIAGLVGAYLLYASNKEAGIKPPIELQAQSEPETHYFGQHSIVQSEPQNAQNRPIPDYVTPADARWLHKPQMQSESSAAPESVQCGFNDQ